MVLMVVKGTSLRGICLGLREVPSAMERRVAGTRLCPNLTRCSRRRRERRHTTPRALPGLHPPEGGGGELVVDPRVEGVTVVGGEAGGQGRQAILHSGALWDRFQKKNQISEKKFRKILFLYFNYENIFLSFF